MQGVPEYNVAFLSLKPTYMCALFTKIMTFLEEEVLDIAETLPGFWSSPAGENGGRMQKFFPPWGN